MTPKDELEVKILIDAGHTLKNVAERTGWSYSKISKLNTKFKQGHVPDLEGEVRGDLDLSSGERMKDTYDTAIKLLHRSVKDIENGYEIEDENRRRVPIKTIMECIEKAGRYATTMAKAAESSGSQGQQNVDYKNMAKLYVSFNENTGKFEYDSHEHMKDLLDKVEKTASDS